MANRFQTPDVQFVNSAGAPYAGGSLSFYASGTDTPLDTYTNAALTIPNLNPVPLDSASGGGDIFLQNLAYKVVLKDRLGNQIWTADPVYSSDFSAVAQFQSGAGSPNGTVAGTAGSPGIPASAYWDTTNNILYIATVTGTASTTVWTAINASSAAAVVPPPTGYLTPVSGTPIIATDAIAVTTIYYTPLVGNTVPIYNGASFVPTAFIELSLDLTAAQAATTLYDVFVFNNSGVLTLVTGPAWQTSTAGAGARGTGAATTELSRINGIYTNAALMTGRNGANSYAINANRATYLGTIFIDAAAGQVTCHRTWGQSRKWGIWNAYNRAPISMDAGDSTPVWNYGTTTWRASNGAATNSITVMTGLAEELIDNQFVQSTTNSSTPAIFLIGIGWNSIIAPAGTQIGGTGAIAAVQAIQAHGHGEYTALPFLGIATVTSLERGVSGTAAFNGTEASMRLSATYRG